MRRKIFNKENHKIWLREKLKFEKKLIMSLKAVNYAQKC